jgi:chemotaxis protein CheC
VNPYNDMQLDALRELANIASGTAATSLSQMLGRDVDLSVPRALALPLAEAVEAVGDPAELVMGVVLPLEGDFAGVVLLLIKKSGAEVLCRLLGVDPESEIAESAMGEIGNIVGASYLQALGSMTGLDLLPCPPHVLVDLLGAIVASILAETAGRCEYAFVLDSELDVAGDPCAISFMLLPNDGNPTDLLAPLGLAETTA